VIRHSEEEPLFSLGTAAFAACKAAGRTRRPARRSREAAIRHDRPRHRQAHPHGAAASKRHAKICRRAAAAGIATKLGNHRFRETGIAAYLKNGGSLENAQPMTARESPRTTKLYDRTGDEITLNEVERITI
jgi:hypothetical protein